LYLRYCLLVRQKVQSEEYLAESRRRLAKKQAKTALLHLHQEAVNPSVPTRVARTILMVDQEAPTPVFIYILQKLSLANELCCKPNKARTTDDILVNKQRS